MVKVKLSLCLNVVTLEMMKLRT